MERKINKVIFAGEIKIDLTGDTVTPEKLAQGAVAHNAAGEVIEGTSTMDVDSTDATAVAGDILTGKTAYARGEMLSGTMPERGTLVGTIKSKNQVIHVLEGHYKSSGSVEIDAAEKNKIVPGNIKLGENILGVTGTYDAAEMADGERVVTPAMAEQVVEPSQGKKYLTKVIVEKIPVSRVQNTAGGETLTIG